MTSSVYFNHVFSRIPDPNTLSTSSLPSLPSTSLSEHHSYQHSRPQPNRFPHQLGEQQNLATTILPHWGLYVTDFASKNTNTTYSINNITYTLQNLSDLYVCHNSDNSYISTQISKTLLDGAALPAEPYSSILQDEVRLGQSYSLPQVGISPRQLELSTIRSRFIHIETEISTDTPNLLRKMNRSTAHNLKYTPLQMDIDIPHMNHTTSTLRPITIDSPSHRYHIAQNNSNNTFNKSRSDLSPSDGFFFSDDSIVHSLLPHFTPDHLSASSSHNTTPATDSQGNISFATRSQQRPISTLPGTQQHLPDYFNSYQESGLSQQHNREGEYPWITPAISLSWDVYKRLSLLTPPAQNDFLQSHVSCLHRRHVPRFLALLFYPCISQKLPIPSIQPSHQYFKLQSSFLDVLLSYQQGISNSTIHSPSQSDKNTTESTPSSFQVSNSMSILQYVLTSIQTSFSSAICIKKHHNIDTLPPSLTLPSSECMTHDQGKYLPHQAHVQLIENQQLEIDLAPLQAFHHGGFGKIVYPDRDKVHKHGESPSPDFRSGNVSHPQNQNGRIRDPNHPTSMYTHDLAPNPTTAQTSSLALSRLNYSPNFREKLQESNKLKSIVSSSNTTSVIAQPFLPLFENQSATKNFLLFNHESESTTIYPFPTSSVQSIFSNPFRYFTKTQLPRISFAQLLSSCFPRCIETPVTIITKLNNLTANYIHKHSLTFDALNVYHKSRIKRGLEISKIPQPILDDLYLQVATSQIVMNHQYHIYPDLADSLLRYFDAISHTPLLYLISPLAMVSFLSYWFTTSDTVDHYSLFQSLIRWSIYHTTLRYQSHQRTCPFLKNRKDEYLQVIQYSLDQYKLVQSDYMMKLRNATPKSASLPLLKDKSIFPTTVRDVVDKIKAPSSINENESNLALLSSPPPPLTNSTSPTIAFPLPPPFTLQVPPSLQSKYQTHLDFINTPNPCEFCYRYEGIQVVFKPWTQPSSNTHSSSCDSLHTNNDEFVHTLPSSVFDMNFFQINTHPGFDSQSSLPFSKTMHNSISLANRYDLSSGKINDSFGHFLAFSPKTLKDISSSPPSVRNILSHFHQSHFTPQSTHFINKDPKLAPFTAIFSTDTSNAISIPISQHQQPTPLFSQLQSTQYSIPFSRPYGLHIPSHIIRNELAPIFQLFPYATFTSSQLSQLFQQPSLFTPYEQFYIISSRFLPLAVDSDNISTTLKSPETQFELAQNHPHPYYPLRPGTTPQFVEQYSDINPHTNIRPFRLFDATFPVFKPFSNRAIDQHARYICPLFDDQTSHQHYHNTLRLEMGKGLFAQAANPQFNLQQTRAYTNLISTMMYEKYNSCVQTNGIPATSFPSSVPQSYQQNSPIQKQIRDTTSKTPTQSQSQSLQVQIQDPYLKAFYTKYHHNLRSTLQSLPGYRDGLFSIDLSTSDQFISPPFDDRTNPQNGNLQFTARFADTREYTIVFPFSQLPVIEAAGVHPIGKWISGEYLLGTQQFTRNVLVEQSTMYPYLHTMEMNHKHKNAQINDSKNDEILFPSNNNNNTSSITHVSSISLDDIDTDELSYDISHHVELHSNENSTSTSQSIPHISMDSYQTIQQNKITQPQFQNHYYETNDNFNNLPVALPSIHGTQFLFNNLTSNSFKPKIFLREAERRRLCPDATLFWNWRVAPALGILSSFASLIILGLIYEKKLEATPTNLIPLLILACLVVTFPFLLWLQAFFERAMVLNRICCFRKCCGKDARLCHPDPWYMEEESFFESSVKALTFGEDFEDDWYGGGSSIGRFFGAFGLTWLLVSVYIRLSGLLELSLVAQFVPLYVCHGLQLITGWYVAEWMFCFEFGPILGYVISLGVLHGALADPGNDKYNAIAITAPFLIPFAAFLIIGIIFIYADFICDDEEIDRECCMLGFSAIFIYLVMAFWYAFVCLLLQDFVRPGSWYVPPYWAVHTVTYILFILSVLSVTCSFDSRRILLSANNVPPSSSHLHDDIKTEPEFTQLHNFFPSKGSSRMALSRFEKHRDTMSRL